MSLTPRQLEVLQFVRSFLQKNQYAPTLQEIGDHFDLSRVTVLQHLRALEEKDYIRREDHRARSIELLEKARSIQQDEEKNEEEDREEEPRRAAVSSGRAPGISDGNSFSLLGYIAAGEPIEAIENPESLSMQDLVRADEETYLLQVKGQSMSGDNIQEGDYVVVREKQTVSDGDMVVALLREGEATLKRFYDRGDRIELRPSNPDHESIYVQPRDLEVQGVVEGLIRGFR